MTKQDYKANRDAGRRGQGPKFDPVVAIDMTPASSRRGLGLRKRTKNPIFTKPGHGRLMRFLHFQNKAFQERHEKPTQV